MGCVVVSQELAGNTARGFLMSKFFLRQRSVTLSLFLLSAITSAETLFASDGEGAHLNLYATALNFLGVNEALSPLVSSLLSLSVCLGFGLFFRRSVNQSLKNKHFTPDEKFSLRTFLEMVLSFLDELTREQCGKLYDKCFPLLAAIFTFILIGNLSGLVPGLPPFTENFSANLVIGLIVFLYYNSAGVSEHGLGYIKQFTGPFLVLAPLFLVLESISHLARPLSLSLRLSANIFGDHLLLGIFAGLVPLVVPALLMFFSLLVAVIQSFVFTMLTSIYISMATSHDH